MRCLNCYTCTSNQIPEATSDRHGCLNYRNANTECPNKVIFCGITHVTMVTDKVDFLLVKHVYLVW